MPYKAQINVTDADGENGSTSLYFDDSLTLAALTTELQSVVEAMDDLIEGVVTGVNVSLGVDTGAWALKATTSGERDRLEGGRFIFSTAEGYKASFTLPTFDRAAYVPAGSENINQADATVTALTDAVIAATTTTNQGNALTGVAAAYEVFGGRR